MATTTAARRGRPRLLTVQRVVDAAIAHVDDEGIGALTVEAVARRLGVGTMTVYGYVRSRDDLIDRAVTQLVAQVPPVPRQRSGDWVEDVVAHAMDVYRWAVAHPAWFALRAERPRVSDAVAARVDDELRGLMRVGFSKMQAAELRHAMGVLLHGQVLWEAFRRSSDTRTPNVLDGVQPSELYERALRALLDGSGAHLRPRASKRARA